MDITYNLLKLKGATCDDLDLFEREFGRGPAPLDDETAIKYAGEFDLDWAAANLFPALARRLYETAQADAWVDCEKVYGTAWAKYEKVRNTASAEYEKVCKPARAEYEKARAWAEYQKVYDTAWAEYEKAVALAFVRIAREL